MSFSNSAVTLRTAFLSFHREAGHSDRYVEDVLKAIEHWERCTPNPPLSQITNQVMHEFKNSFMTSPLPPRSAKSKQPARCPSAATTSKILRTLSAILATCGPQQYGNKYGRGIIDTIPCTRPPKVPDPDVVTASAEEVSAIYEQCQIASWPDGPINPVDWWRCLVVYLFNVGSRRNDFLSLRRSQVNLARMEIRDRQQKPGKSDIKPINATLVSHFESIWQPVRQRIFECPNASKSLYKQWHAIQEAAGIVVDRPDNSIRKAYYGFHEMRKTCGTELLLISPIAAQHTLGHSDLKTTEKHYGKSRRLMDALRPAVDALPQPQAFLDQSGPLPPPSPSPTFFEVARELAVKASRPAPNERPVFRVVG